MKSISVKFWLRKSKSSDVGAVYCRLRYDSSQEDIPTHIKVPVVKWKGQRFASTGPDADQANTKLEAMRTKLNNIATKLYVGPDADKLSASYVRAVYEGKAGQAVTLLKVIDEVIEKRELSNKQGKSSYAVIVQYKKVKADITEFLSKKYRAQDVSLERIATRGTKEYNFADDYVSWLRENKGWKENTLFKEVTLASTCFNHAIKRGYIILNPFRRLEMKAPESDAFKYLTSEELSYIEAYECSGNTRISRDIFLFSCYTGLAYADLKKISEENIHKGIEGYDWIFIGRQKTRNSSKNICKIPLEPQAKEIIEKYHDHPRRPHDRLLPVYSNVWLNRHLLTVKDKVNDKEDLIDKHITMHVARHTFAIRKLDEGFSFDVVADMLGHSDTSMLRKVYGEVTPKRIVKEMNTLHAAVNFGK